jgi:outer membrane protein TolC
MARRKYIEGMLTLVQRLNAEARLARLNRQIAKLEGQRKDVEARLAADIEARIASGELQARGRAA